jgi:hypothetical protein
MPVRAMTQNSKAIEDLQAADFGVSENRSPLKLCGFSHVRQPSSIGILLDTSGSMGSGFDGLVNAKAGVNELLNTAGPEDEFFIEYVNDGPVQHGFSRDLDQIRAALNVSPKGRTALIDAVYLALDAMRGARYVNRALLVISDAYDNVSVYKSGDVASAISNLPVPIFLIVPCPPLDRFRRGRPLLEGEAAVRSNFVRLVSQSGGFALKTFNKEDMIASVTQLGKTIRSPYILSFRQPPQQTTVQRLNLSVKVTGVHPQPLLFYKGVIRYVR